MRRDLFETLAKMIGCIYISDLLFIEDPNDITSAIKAIDVEDFDVIQWNDALNYFTGSTVKFDNSFQAKMCLLNSKINTKRAEQTTG